MYTEDDIASALRSGALTLVDAMRLFAEDKVHVYAAEVLNPETAMYDEVEDFGAGSADLFSALYRVKATPDQIEEVKDGIRRAREAGRTIQSLWSAT